MSMHFVLMQYFVFLKEYARVIVSFSPVADRISSFCYPFITDTALHAAKTSYCVVHYEGKCVFAHENNLSWDKARRMMWSPSIPLISSRQILPLARMSIYPSVLFQVSFTWLNIGQSLQVTNTHYFGRMWEKKCWRQYINTQEQGFQVELELCDKSTGPEISQQWLPVWPCEATTFHHIHFSCY